MKLFAQLVGILAVATFLLSYQQKKRKQIIFVNAISSIYRYDISIYKRK